MICGTDTYRGVVKAKQQNGSHIFTAHPDRRYTTLPHHGNQELGRSLTRQILREIDIKPDEFSRLIKDI